MWSIGYTASTNTPTREYFHKEIPTICAVRRGPLFGSSTSLIVYLPQRQTKCSGTQPCPQQSVRSSKSMCLKDPTTPTRTEGVPAHQPEASRENKWRRRRAGYLVPTPLIEGLEPCRSIDVLTRKTNKSIALDQVDPRKFGDGAPSPSLRQRASHPRHVT